MKDCKFTVHLIDARTKIPLKEFFDGDGNAYVEAAPDLEWLFYLRNDGDEPAIGKILWVDGVFIGYNVIMEAKRVRNGIGLWNVKGNIQSDTALQFSLQTNLIGTAPKNGISASPHFGRVVVKFYQALGSGVEKRHNLGCDGRADFRREQAKVKGVDQTNGSCVGKKVFMTDIGAHQTDDEVYPQTLKDYEPGKIVGSVTIQYCSTLGLIHKGILPNTPQQTAGGAVNAPMKGSEGIDTSAAGAIRLDLEKEEEEKKEEVTGEGLEIVSSCSEPARKKSKIGEK